MDQVTDSILPSSAESEYAVNALDAVTIKFVNNIDYIEKVEGFHPEFAHQHFGQNEIIFGYSGLSVSLIYTNCSMYIYPLVTFDKDITSVRSDIKPDNIIEKLRAQLPSWDMDAMVSSREKFRIRLEEQTNFQPYGELIFKFHTRFPRWQRDASLEGGGKYSSI